MLHTYTPDRWNKLVVICDSRMKRDRQIQDTEGGAPVLEQHGFFGAVFGRAEWARTARIALYDYREDVNALTPENAARVSEESNPKKQERQRKALVAQQRKEKREALLRTLKELNPGAVLILQSQAAKSKSKEDDPLENATGTMCWETMGAPDSFSSMQGCCWDAHGHGFGPVIALPNSLNYEHVWGWLFRRWCRMALDVAQGKARPIECPEKVIEQGPRMTAALARILKSAEAGVRIAVDIESHSGKHIITAVGLADKAGAVSVPWESFVPYGREEVEPGLHKESEGEMVRRILASSAPKVGHNMQFDLTFLAEKGAPMGGEIHDTMVLQKVIPPYTQFRRGLQAVAAQEFCVRPWKSAWHPKVKGLTKEDADWWALDPLGLRDYNTDDTWITGLLFDSLRWKAGI